MNGIAPKTHWHKPLLMLSERLKHKPQQETLKVVNVYKRLLHFADHARTVSINITSADLRAFYAGELDQIHHSALNVLIECFFESFTGSNSHEN